MSVLAIEKYTRVGVGGGKSIKMGEVSRQIFKCCYSNVHEHIDYVGYVYKISSVVEIDKSCSFEFSSDHQAVWDVEIRYEDSL